MDSTSSLQVQATVMIIIIKLLNTYRIVSNAFSADSCDLVQSHVLITITVQRQKYVGVDVADRFPVSVASVGFTNI